MQMVTNSTVAMIVKDIYILIMIVVFKDTQLYAYIHIHERYDVLIDLWPFLYRYWTFNGFQEARGMYVCTSLYNYVVSNAYAHMHVCVYS